MLYNRIKHILPHFCFEGIYESADELHSGNINTTYHLCYRDGAKLNQYILQSINTYVFHDPHAVMDNIEKITRHLRSRLEAEGVDTARRVLEVIPTHEGDSLHVSGGYWRAYRYIDNATGYDAITRPKQFEEAGRAFGEFQKLLCDFPAHELHVTIPDFHNTRARFQAFKEFVEEDRAGRVESCKADVEFALARQELAESIVKQLESGELPLRVTHNDTKINNILMDADTDEPLCIIDLDTIMPGACAYDFGDSIRFGASSAAEDEQDLDKVYLRMDLFEAYVKGYLEAVAQTVTPAEVKSLAQGALVITYEQGIRFLGDHLNGDVYFKIHREGQNLDRARTQFKLVKEMEERMDEMQVIVEKYYKLANESM